MQKKSTIKKLTALAETKFLNLYDALYINKKGDERHWMIASRKPYEVLKSQYFNHEEDQLDAVVIAAYHEGQKKVVLVKQYRVPLNDYIYELPAGLVEGGLGIQETLKKELREETGLEFVKHLEELSHPKVYLSAGMTDESVAFAYCTCTGELSDAYLEDDEELVAVLVSQEEASKLLSGNEKIDIKAYMLLQSFQRMGESLFKV